MKKILLGIAVILFSAMCCVIYKEYHWDFLEVVYVFSPLLVLALLFGVHLKKRETNNLLAIISLLRRAFELTNLNIVFSHRQSPLPYIAVK